MHYFFTIFTNPEKTLLELPHERIILVGLLVPLILALDRALYSNAFDRLGVIPTLFMMLAVLGVAAAVGPWLVHGLCRLFGKRLTYCYLFNLYCISQTPRLFTRAALWILALGDGISNWHIQLLMIGLAATLYSAFLFIYGLWVRPSMPPPEPRFHAPSSSSSSAEW